MARLAELEEELAAQLSHLEQAHSLAAASPQLRYRRKPTTSHQMQRVAAATAGTPAAGGATSFFVHPAAYGAPSAAAEARELRLFLADEAEDEGDEPVPTFEVASTHEAGTSACCSRARLLLRRCFGCLPATPDGPYKVLQ